MPLNRTSKSKVMAVWIYLVFWCLISSISIYYVPELDIRVRGYDHLTFSRAFVVQFQASQYIIGLNRTFESKVVVVWICLVLWCLISSVSIYYEPESNIRVNRYVHLNFSRASVVQFQVSRYIIGPDQTSEWELWPHEFAEMFRCYISRVSIYYWPGSNIRVKSCGPLNLPCTLMFNFKHLNILCAWIEHSSQKLWPFWILRELLLYNFERLNIYLAWIEHPSQNFWPFGFPLCFDI